MKNLMVFLQACVGSLVEVSAVFVQENMFVSKENVEVAGNLRMDRLLNYAPEKNREFECIWITNCD